MKKKSITIGFSLLLISSMTGCIGPSRTVQDAIFERHNSTNDRFDETVDDSERLFLPPRTPGDIPPAVIEQEGYNRDVYAEHNNLFSRLPNPTIVIHFNPRMADTGMGMPGFDTAISMYNKVHFATPHNQYGLNELENQRQKRRQFQATEAQRQPLRVRLKQFTKPKTDSSTPAVTDPSSQSKDN